MRMMNKHVDIEILEDGSVEIWFRKPNRSVWLDAAQYRGLCDLIRSYDDNG